MFDFDSDVLIKVTMIIYLHEAFHFAKNWGVTLKVEEGINEKPLKKSHKISFLA